MRNFIPQPFAGLKSPLHFVLFFLMALSLCLRSTASTLYYDSFETYPVANPAPNPLTNGPAGGQWFYVDNTPPTTTALEHRIAESFVAGGALNSRCWYSATNYAMLTNAISLAALPPGTNLHTFHLSFVMASDTFTTGRNTTFAYGISSSGGTLTFISGGNASSSQTFSGLNDFGLASSGSLGKSPDRQFQVTFQGANLTSNDKIYVQLERITNDAGALLGMLMDDVRLTVDDNNGPLAQTPKALLTFEHVQIPFSDLVDPTSATNPANYALSGGLMVQTATLISPNIVELYTTDQAPGSNYTVNVSGVSGLNGASMVATQLNFTTPTLGISPVRYDAGNITNQPSGPPDPATLDGGFWTPIINTNPGMTAGPVSADNGTSYNAWNVTDQNVLSSGGSLNYTLPIDQPSDNLARSNGWRITLRSRLVDNFGGTAADQICSYSDNTLSLRFGLFFGVNTSGYLFVTVLGGNNYNLTSDINSYHTHMLVYDAPSASASYYFDGQLIVSNYPGQSVAGVNGLTFGSANSAGSGAMNYNLVQMDVVGAKQPTITLQPLSTTNGVGQKVTFTAAFSQFVNAYQWLSNEVVIPGATTTTYTTGFIATNYNGSSYTCRALSAFGNVETAPAILTVTTDVTPPFVAAIKASLIPGHVIVTYSEPVQASYATNAANYAWTGVGGGISTVSAIMLDPLTVELIAAPLTNGNYYTLQINNIRDTSNLIIATNSLATFFDPQLLDLYSYNAGDVTNQPSGPPDPTQVDGGDWNLRLDVDTNLSVGPVTNDLGTGLNGWQVRDASTVFGDYVYYAEPVATQLFPQIFNAGWLLTIRCRLSETFPGAPVALFTQLADANNNRYGLSFNLDNNNNLIVGNSVGNAFVTQTVLNDGSGLNDYHTHQIYYNPATTNASYYFDGNLMLSGWAFSNVGASTPEGLLWGALSSAGKGTMNVNLIDLSAAPFPFATVATTNGLQIAYRGILQAATNLTSPATWTSVATNTTTGTNLYSVPAGATQQYFRSRMP